MAQENTVKYERRLDQSETARLERLLGGDWDILQDPTLGKLSERDAVAVLRILDGITESEARFSLAMAREKIKGDILD